MRELGVPVDRLERVVILGLPPPDDWLLLLQQLCGQLLFADTPAAAIEAALGATAVGN